MASEPRPKRPPSPTSVFQEPPDGTQPGGRLRFLWALHRTFVAGAMCFIGAGLLGCSKSDQLTPPGSAQPQRGSEQPDLVPQTPTAHKRQIPDLFEPLISFQVQSSTTLLDGVPDQLSREDLEKLKLPVTKEQPKDLFLAVDQHAPRAYRAEGLTISDLLNEDIELAPGPHRLVVFRAPIDEVLEIQTHTFFVDVEPTKREPETKCLAFSNPLTRNGPAASASLWVTAIPLISDIDRVEYSASGESLLSRGATSAGTVVSLKDPPNGDIELSVRCFAGDQELGADTQIVTVNRDAPDPESNE